MAQTFENGEGLNSIRGKLNANAVQINDLQSDANLYVDTFAQLVALTDANVAVGRYVQVRSIGAWYQRVASGGMIGPVAPVNCPIGPIAQHGIDALTAACICIASARGRGR